MRSGENQKEHKPTRNKRGCAVDDKRQNQLADYFACFFLST
jgi:hypothetical protein